MGEINAFWAGRLREHWGLEARLTRLDGEYDLNFLVEATNGQDYVLKVMRPRCDAGLVDLQIKALEHLGEAAPGLPFPAVLPDLNGGLLPEIIDTQGQVAAGLAARTATREMLCPQRA